MKLCPFAIFANFFTNVIGLSVINSEELSNLKTSIVPNIALGYV
jgi:hypothetical protein